MRRSLTKKEPIVCRCLYLGYTSVLINTVKCVASSPFVSVIVAVIAVLS